MASVHLNRRVDPTERALLVGRLMIAGGLALTAVSLLGEYLRWWNDWGEVGIVVGVVGTFLGIALTYLLGATRSQVAAVGGTVAAGFEEANRKFDEANRKHDVTNQRLAEMTVLLAQIRDRL